MPMESLIFHLLPSLLGQKKEILDPVVIVISPLNIIQNGQLSTLKKYSISACKLDNKGNVNILDTELSMKKEEETFSFHCSSAMDDINNGKHSVIVPS